MINHGRTFVPGKLYRARKTFTAGSTFEAGEVLVFERDLFSWYDEAQVYEFHRHTDNKPKQWIVGDEFPLDSWMQYFELLGDEMP
jgi:hypothetical protein